MTADFDRKLKDHADNCATCVKYKRKNARPVVGMLLSKEFNGTLAMDLKQYEKRYILHIIDLATRYSNAVMIESKKKEVIVEKIITAWINIFGVPDRILSDNGGEFNNDELQNMSENLNIEITTTAAESPWSNGVCERRNTVIGNMINKIKNETDCTTEVALAWAINAKNYLHNVYGFSPSQLVFGKNPNLPTVLNDKLPSLEGKTSSEVVATHINVKHEARKAFIECEASEKIRRALRHNIRESTTMVFQTGDKVYYKRLGCDYWKGPGIVIGKDNHQVIVKHGGSFIRVHPVSLRLVDASENKQVTENTLKGQTEKPEIVGNEEIQDHQEHTTDMNETQEIQEDLETQDEPQARQSETEILANEEIVQQADRERADTETSQEIYKNIVQKPKMRIEYKCNETDRWQEAIVINRGGKANGKHHMWMNIQDMPQDTQKSHEF